MQFQYSDIRVPFVHPKYIAYILGPLYRFSPMKATKIIKVFDFFSRKDYISPKATPLACSPTLAQFFVNIGGSGIVNNFNPPNR